jgi:beta-lactamase superfamily II metal-dependent hydrolase
VVLVPAQGRAAARQAQLLRAAAPRLAILSAAAHSARSASTTASLAAWRAAGAQTRVTGIDGALELQFTPDGQVDLDVWFRSRIGLSEAP